MIQPFLLETVDPAMQVLCEELARKQQIIRKLADEYADVYLPLDEVLHTETDEKPAYYSADGVHPTPDGACFIGEAYLRAVAPLIELLSKEDR
jgi:lysophospholipase L1-like esterase